MFRYSLDEDLIRLSSQLEIVDPVLHRRWITFAGIIENFFIRTSNQHIRLLSSYGVDFSKTDINGRPSPMFRHYIKTSTLTPECKTKFTNDTIQLVDYHSGFIGVSYEFEFNRIVFYSDF